MKASEFQLGMRVKRRTDASSFVRDRPSSPDYKGRRIGIVVGLPLTIDQRHRAVTIQWEGTSRSESVLIHRLVALPLVEQPIALGGEWTAGPDTFVEKRAR
jgi:hypothetical protein